MASKDRPLLISIISVLQMLFGALIILSGVIFTVAMLTLGQAIIDTLPPDMQAYLSLVSAFLNFLGILIIIFGLLIFLLGRGLWNMKKWAWAIELVLYLLNAISYLTSINFLISALQTGYWNVLVTPIVTFLLVIYFIMIRDKF